MENQLFIALITYCLLALLKLEANYCGPLLTIKRVLCTCLYASFESSFVQMLCRKPMRESKGRRKVDYDIIYHMTVKQFVDGESEHLDDLTYDPLVL
ncbi:MAG TPA: hypothetical protein DCK87_01665 [Desulfotomaculum sp.]|nr:hypothetical protein [Desulfotomaculum sp.]